jgi:hypothetical protein
MSLRPCRVLASWALAFASAIGVMQSHAAPLPERPDLDSAAAAREEQRENVRDAIGRLELLTGQPLLVSSKDRKRYAARFGTPLAPGDVIQTQGGSRCRIVLASGDVLHVGEGSLVGLDKAKESWIANLWRGRVMAYGMPALQGRQQPLRLRSEAGEVELKAGKVLFTADGLATSMMVFDNRVLWRGADGAEAVLAAGQSWSNPDGKFAASSYNPKEEETLSLQVSPEVPAAKSGLKAYTEGDLAGAREIFQNVQTSFPYNSVAAYYLGLMLVQQQDSAGAAQQWKTVVLSDPEFAARNQLPQHLTLLLTVAMNEEIKSALANETKLSVQPPEPNSIAVRPFANTGGEKYKVLSKGLTAMIISDLSKVPNLKVLERAKLQRLEDELKLSKEGLVDSETALRTGRLLKSEKMLIGDYLIEARP